MDGARKPSGLRAARVDGVPPRGLEETTVAALRERGLVRPPRRRLMAVAALVAMAAALVVAVGWSVMRQSALGPAPPSSPRFVLLLYAGTDPVAGTPDTRRSEYAQWARDVAAGGTAISGEELSDDAREVPAGRRAAGGRRRPAAARLLRGQRARPRRRAADRRPRARTSATAGGSSMKRIVS